MTHYTSIHLFGFTFGDQIEVISTPFNFGSESILTLHRIKKEGRDQVLPQPVDVQEFYDFPREDCLYVETFNRWIARSRKDANQDLIRSSPVDFNYDHLCSLPDRYSPRLVCGYARSNNTFHDTQSPNYVPVVDAFDTEYQVDPTRDIKGGRPRVLCRLFFDYRWSAFETLETSWQEHQVVPQQDSARS